MILNEHTTSHPIYQRQLRRRAKKQPAPDPVRQVEGNPNGSLAERCAWMRAKQQKAKAAGGAK
jgi:hypothetical protein